MLADKLEEFSKLCSLIVADGNRNLSIQAIRSQNEIEAELSRSNMALADTEALWFSQKQELEAEIADNKNKHQKALWQLREEISRLDNELALKDKVTEDFLVELSNLYYDNNRRNQDDDMIENCRIGRYGEMAIQRLLARWATAKAKE